MFLRDVTLLRAHSSQDKRNKFSRKRLNEDEGDVTYINERNRVFNKKARLPTTQSLVILTSLCTWFLLLPIVPLFRISHNRIKITPSPPCSIHLSALTTHPLTSNDTTKHDRTCVSPCLVTYALLPRQLPNLYSCKRFHITAYFRLEMQIARYYDKYTAEIRDSFERGTAL